MKKTLLTIFLLICTIFTITGCGNSTSKFEGTWYYIGQDFLYKMVVTKENEDLLIKGYTGRYFPRNGYLNETREEKWSGFTLDAQELGKLKSENTLVVDKKFFQRVWTVENDEQIKAYFPGHAEPKTFTKSTKLSEEDALKELRQKKIEQNQGQNKKTIFVD